MSNHHTAPRTLLDLLLSDSDLQLPKPGLSLSLTQPSLVLAAGPVLLQLLPQQTPCSPLSPPPAPRYTTTSTPSLLQATLCSPPSRWVSAPAVSLGPFLHHHTDYQTFLHIYTLPISSHWSSQRDPPQTAAAQIRVARHLHGAPGIHPSHPGLALGHASGNNPSAVG